MAATVNAKSVRGALWAAKALGLDVVALVEQWALADVLTDVDARVPHRAWLGLWQDMIDRTGSESIGIDAAERLPWGHFDVIDYLIGTSEHLGAALRRIERYFALLSTGVTHKLEPHGDAVHLVRRYAANCETRLLAPAEFALSNIVIRMRRALGVHWCPREVQFAAPAPSNDATQRRLFGCPIRFETRRSALVITAGDLALPMQLPDPELARILECHAEAMVGKFGAEPDLVAEVRRIIVDTLPDANVSVGNTARQLGMSARTLQRRLQDSGVTFDDVYERARNDLARRYLADSNLSIQETAHLLAFGDLRGFYRAFRRWEGCTPAEYRQQTGRSSH